MSQNVIKKPLPTVGMLLMLLNNLALALLDTCSKSLRLNLSASVIVFTYKITLLLCVLPWVLSQGRAVLKTKRLSVHFLRSICGTAGAVFFIRGLQYIDMADAAALENVQYIIVIIMGVIFFGDKLTWRKSLALFVGFIGVLIIIYPEAITRISRGASGLSEGFEFRLGNYIWTFIGISFWAVDTLVIKSLGNTEANKTQIFYKLLFASFLALPGALMTWQIDWNHVTASPVVPADQVQVYQDAEPSAAIEFTGQVALGLANFHFTTAQLAVVLSMAVLFFVHSLAYINAVRVDLSTVIPLRYSKLLFSVICGYLFFGEVSSLVSYFGYVLVILSGAVLFHDEMAKQRAHKAKSKAS